MGIKEVAKLAGVSPSTVSRVVNSGDINAASPETQAKIWNAVHSLGYVPNENAQKLKKNMESVSQVSMDIDCVYSRSVGSEIDPFFVTMMHAVEVEAFAHGYHLRYQYSAADMIAGKIHLPSYEVSSAVVLGLLEPETFMVLKSRYKNIVYVGLQISDLDIDQVVSNGYKATYECVNYLHSLGHKHICYLGETENEQRFDAFKAAMRELIGDKVTPIIANASFSPSSGYDSVNQLLNSKVKFTSILCSNDILAVGALRALKEHGLKVPDDVSVIGINDMEMVRYLDPMLTAIHIHIEELGKHAAKLLIDRINGGHKLPMKIIIPYSLVKRDSCGSVKSN